MNLRQHFSEPDYSSAILLSYNIEPEFFENIILRDLHLSNINEIIVICDKSQEEILNNYDGKIKDLGKKYILELANTKGRFHPKIYLKLGKNRGNLTICSSNLSPGGWGHNMETGLSFDILPDELQKCANVYSLIQTIKTLLKNQNVIEILDNILNKYSWIQSITGAADTNDLIILNTNSSPFFNHLKRRMDNKVIESVTILTGSTDESGAFITECISQFGIKKFDIYLTPSYSRFDNSAFKKINADVSLYNVENKYLHSKFYYFHGEKPFAIIGSANCSRAAWLNPPSGGGNVESMMFLEDINEQILKKILEPLPKVASDFDTINSWGNNILTKGKNPEGQKSNRLISITFDSTTNKLKAQFDKRIDRSTDIFLIYNSQKYTPLNNHLEPSAEFEFFVDYEPSFKSQYAEIHVSNSGNTDIYKKWIDDINQIKYSSKGVRLYSTFQSISEKLRSSELDSALKEVEKIKEVIFKGDVSFDDSNIFQTREEIKTETIQQNSRSLSINDLVKKLNTISSFSDELESHKQSKYALNLFGIVRYFFDPDKKRENIKKINRNDLDDDTEKSNVDDDESEKLEKFKRKMKKIIETYIEGLEKENFAKKCTVLQLTQAISFPLGICYLGFSLEYFTISEVENWFFKLLNVLFYKKYEDHNSYGLIKRVKIKYIENDKVDLFENTISDGVLFLLLQLMVCRIYEQSIGKVNITLMYYLKLAIESDILVSKINPEKLENLIHISKFDSMFEELTKILPSIQIKLQKIDDYIKSNFSLLIQDDYLNEIKQNDIIYGTINEWGFVNGMYESHDKKKGIFWEIFFPKKGESGKYQIQGNYISINKLLHIDNTVWKLVNEIYPTN